MPKHEFGARMDTAVADLLLESFNSSTPTKARVLHKLDQVREFNRLDEKRAKNPENSASYRARMAVADGLLHILRSHRVLQPVTKYRIKVGKLQIDGEYAILQQKKQDPAILQLRSDEYVCPPDLITLPPNLISYARHWHLLFAHDYSEASVLALHIPTGESWNQWLPVAHSQTFVSSAAAVYEQQLQFPAPGVHCGECLSAACLNRKAA